MSVQESYENNLSSEQILKTPELLQNVEVIVLMTSSLVLKDLAPGTAALSLHF